MRSKSSFNKCNDLDLNEIKSNQWQDKETDSLTASVKTKRHISLCVTMKTRSDFSIQKITKLT